jgi:NADH-quinone oxidoreductase subunit L
MVEYFYLITVLPLVGFLINGLFGTKIKNEKVSGIIGSLMVLGSFIITVLAYLHITTAAGIKKYHHSPFQLDIFRFT